MNSVQGSTIVPGLYGLIAPAGTPAARPPVLPEPPADTSKCTDGLTMLLALLSKKSQTDAKNGVENVDTAKSEREQKLAEAQAAYAKMKEAENDPMAWLGNVFKAITAVAAAITTVATGGAACPMLTASAMAFGGVVKDTHCFGDLSGAIGAGAGLVGSLGTGSLMMIASDGTQFTGAVGTATHDFDATTSAAFSITGQALGVLGSFSPPAGGGDPVWGTIGMEGKVAGLSGNAAHDIDRTIQGGNAAQAAIDMKQARIEMARVDRMIGMLIDGVKDAHNSHNKAVRAVEGAIETNNQTALVAAGVRG